MAAAAEAARALPFPFTLTARAENFLRGNPDLDDTIRRLQAFERAGADVLFAPGLPDLASVRAVCAAVSKPFNFMAGIKGKSFTVPELEAAGVRRISLATSLYRAAVTGLIDAAREVKDRGTFGYLDRTPDHAGAERVHAGRGCGDPPEPFIERHGLWTDDQRREADALRDRVRTAGLRLVRLAWSDAHGCARAKAVTVPAFLEALAGGYNINVATTTLDSANARTFSSFTRGGGMGLDEMTGSPNITIVPDPATFRVLPWAPGIGWVLCDEYFNSGAPYPFSARHLLRRQLERLRAAGLDYVVGLEVEWYLARVAEDHLTDEHVGVPGVRGRPIATWPVEPGYSYHSESNLDLMHPVLPALAESLQALGLPLRSVENEWGPGQVECTFSAQPALKAADDLVLFRTATRQVCRRLGHFATFMCRPALKGYYSSGWHLHQSLVDAQTGENRFAPARDGDRLSPLGRASSAGCSRTPRRRPCSRRRR